MSAVSSQCDWLESLILSDPEYGARRKRTRDAYRSIGVVGGGTAGFFAALALRARLPHLKVTLIESSDIPIIGVGEATVPPIVAFLHGTLGIEIEEFYREVKPTWKQGIKFEWGLPGDYHFQAPFDWGLNSVGLLGSLQHRGDINGMTIQALMMERGVTPVFKQKSGRYRSLLHRLPHAYHLDNVRLVRFLHKKALQAGVRYLDRKIVDAALTPDGEEVDHLVTSAGERLSFDLYIDCSGFRSLLLEQKLRVPFISYADSLFTDRAVVFNAPHGGVLKPYTTAHTMKSGWTWNIPQVEDDHLGYVHASAFCSETQAEAEIRKRFPNASRSMRLVKFRSGRHAEAWKGNVIAIGNAYAFVEPLESTGLLMITEAMEALVSMFPASKEDSASRKLFNSVSARLWDGLRWFLSIHYKFNRKVSTPFWRAVRSDCDISGAQDLMGLVREHGPIHLIPRLSRRIRSSHIILFYGVSGFDCILLGQKVPVRLPASAERTGAWHSRQRRIASLLKHAVPMREALEVVTARPELLSQVLNDPASWLQEVREP